MPLATPCLLPRPDAGSVRSALLWRGWGAAAAAAARVLERRSTAGFRAINDSSIGCTTALHSTPAAGILAASLMYASAACSMHAAPSPPPRPRLWCCPPRYVPPHPEPHTHPTLPAGGRVSLPECLACMALRAIGSGHAIAFQGLRAGARLIIDSSSRRLSAACSAATG